MHRSSKQREEREKSFRIERLCQTRSRGDSGCSGCQQVEGLGRGQQRRGFPRWIRQCEEATVQHSTYLVDDFASGNVSGHNNGLADTDHALRLLRDDLDIHRLGREDIVVPYSAVEME